MIGGNDILMYSLESIFDVSLFAVYRDSILISLLACLFIFGHLNIMDISTHIAWFLLSTPH